MISLSTITSNSATTIDRERQTDNRQTDRQTDKQTTGKQTDRPQTDRYAGYTQLGTTQPHSNELL